MTNLVYLDPTKVIATVTNNGANFVKAFKEFSVYRLTLVYK